MTHTAAAHADPIGWLLSGALLVALVLVYLRGAARVRIRTGRRWPLARTVAWGVGATALTTAVSPVASHVPGSATTDHMAQHVALGMVAPLALVLAAPLTLVLAGLPVGRRRTATAALRARPVRTLTHPVTAAALHVGGLYALYLTPLYAASTRHGPVHAVVLVHFVLAGCLFAWSLVGPERASRPPGLGRRIAVLVVASGAHGYLAKLLYSGAPGLPPGAAVGADEMQDAAQLMYYAGDVAEVALAVALLAGWYRRAARRPSSGRQALASTP